MNDAFVLEANEKFYRAFRNRDVRAMETLWSKGEDVACIHPGWRALRGYKTVIASWRSILKTPRPPKVVCAEPVVTIIGSAAVVVCTERIGLSCLTATNVFRLENGELKLVHHHTGAVPLSLDIDVIVPPASEPS